MAFRSFKGLHQKKAGTHAAFHLSGELVITTCEWNEQFSEIVNFVIMTSPLFMFSLDNVRYEGDTDLVFVVLLLYDKILSNPVGNTE